MCKASQKAAGFQLYPITAKISAEALSLDYFTANLELLSRQQPDLARQLDKTKNTRIEVFPSVRGLPSARYRRDSAVFPLHSRYDPQREAHQSLKKHNLSGADYYIFLGFGLGYILEALLQEKADPADHFFIVESDIEILKAALEARDLSPILSLPNLQFAWPASEADLAEQWRQFFDPVQAQGSAFITHVPSIMLNPSLFKSAAEIIQSQTFQIFTDINTLVEKSQSFLDNFVRNVHKAAAAPGVARFIAKFSQTPAIIVSAGPSLDKNVHELGGFEERALILSTDTALKPLLAAGIDPHFILTGDPFELNYLHLKGATSKEALLVAEATSFPGVFDEFQGKTITCTYENSTLRSLSDLLGNKGTLRAWGSVATMALDFALLLQCNPIIFIGQDLAHTDGFIYCSNLLFDEDWFAGIQDPTEWRKQLKMLQSGKRLAVHEDIFGHLVETTDKLAAYWNWMVKVFKQHPDVQFINATQGGILRHNIAIMDLREALHRFCDQDLDLRNRVQRVYDSAREDNLLYAGLDLSTLELESEVIKGTLDVGLTLCESSDVCSPQDLLKRLEATKESIYLNSHLAPLLDCYNQMGNVAFLRKRNALSRQTIDKSISRPIRDTYAAYFMSVQEALAKIDKALQLITADFSQHPLSEQALENRDNSRNCCSISGMLPIS